MNGNENDLRICIDKITTDRQRYFWTVYITLGFKDFLDNNLEDCRFVYAEKRLKIIDDDSIVQPDFILQYYEDRKGILGEIKSSITYDENYIKKDLYPQLKKYCKDIYGWETEDEKILDHDLLCIYHAVDVGRLTKLIDYSIDTGELDIIKNLCISEYSPMRSPKYGEGDIILIKYEYGVLGCKELEASLKENLKLLIDELTLKYEKIKFTRKKPPVEYLMELLWYNIFRIFAEYPEVKEIEVTLDQLLIQIYNYYISWSGIEGEYSQVRKTWIQEAMDLFVKIELAEIISEAPLIYKIYIGKTGLPNDMAEYIYKESCKLKLDQIKKEKLEETQLKINNFTEK